MTDRGTQLLQVLGIGQDTSSRGEGISLREALERTHYMEVQNGLSPRDLVPIIEANPNFLEEWILYSADKRTSGGWYLTEEGEIGQVGFPESRRSFSSLAEAVAEYVVRELDFWVNVRDAGLE